MSRLVPAATLVLLAWIPFAARGVDAYAAESGREPRFVFASLERTGCFGPCPIYRVDVLGDGTVVYEGTRFVRHKGRREAKLEKERLLELDRTFDEAGFLALPPEDKRAVPDAATVVLAYATDAGARTVRYTPVGATVPPTLARLEREVSRIVELERWIGTDAERDAIAKRRPFMDDTIFRCDARDGKYAGRLVLSEQGGLSMSGSRDGEMFGCRLEVRDLRWAPDDQVGNVTIEARLAGCRDAKGAVLEDRSLRTR
jgi:hypothetical protein